VASKLFVFRRCLGTSQPLPGMQSSESREKLAAFGALNKALLDVLFVSGVRVVWESNFGTEFVLGAPGARKGRWKELARIDWLRGTVKDDQQNIWWEEVFLNVPAFQMLVSDSNLSSTNSRGNVVEACVGASFLAAYELAASGATTPRFHFRTEPADALAQVAAIFPLFVQLGVSSPPLRRPDASERRANGIPGEIKVVEPDAQAGLAAQPRADAGPPRVHTRHSRTTPEPKTPPTLPAVGGHDNEFACARARQKAEAEPAAPTHPAAGGQPRGQPPAEPEPATPWRRTRRRSESRERKGLPRAWSPIPGRPGHRAIGGDGAGSQDDAEVQGFHVSFSRHRDLWRGTRAS
jgi:hypothetical protein